MHALRSGLVVAALGAFVGCQGGVFTPIDRAGSPRSAVGSGFGSGHVMPMTRPGATNETQEALSAAASAHLTYYGGPIIQNVHVTPLFWSSGVQFQSNLNSFYAAVVNSAYYDMLSQYSTSSPAQTLGRGTGSNGFVDSNTSTSVTD